MESILADIANLDPELTGHAHAGIAEPSASAPGDPGRIVESMLPDLPGLGPELTGRAHAGLDGTSVPAPGGAGVKITEVVNNWPGHRKPLFAHVASYCAQHKTGNAVECVTKFLGLLSPSFCSASTLSHGSIADAILEIVKQRIARNLKVVDPATLNFDADDHRELKFQRELLERCHVQDTGPDHSGAPNTGVAKRREEAQDILTFFGAPWTEKYGLVHPCPPGCVFCSGKPEDGPCANRENSIKKAQGFASLLFSPAVSEPAANKYTKVDPCVKSVALMVWSFGLLRKAIGIRLGDRDSGPAIAGTSWSKWMLILPSVSRTMKCSTRDSAAM